MGKPWSAGTPPRGSESLSNQGPMMDLGDVSGMAPSLAREVALMRCAFELAQRSRRNEAQCAASLKTACREPLFADDALYEYKRGDEVVVGLSVDFAREAVRHFPNIHYGFSILSNDDDAYHIEGYAIDLENNRRIPYQDSFRKRIQRKVWDEAKGRKVTQWVEATDEREVQQLLFRHAAFLVRNAILGLLPSGLLNECLQICKQTCEAAAGGDQTAAAAPGQKPADAARDASEKLDRARKNAADWCAANSINVQAVAATFGGVAIAQFDAEQVARFRSMVNALRDNQTTVDELFGPDAIAPRQQHEQVQDPNPQTPAPARSGKPMTLDDLAAQQRK